MTPQLSGARGLLPRSESDVSCRNKLPADTLRSAVINSLRSIEDEAFMINSRWPQSWVAEGGVDGRTAAPWTCFSAMLQDFRTRTEDTRHRQRFHVATRNTDIHIHTVTVTLQLAYTQAGTLFTDIHTLFTRFSPCTCYDTTQPPHVTMLASQSLYIGTFTQCGHNRAPFPNRHSHTVHTI